MNFPTDEVALTGVRIPPQPRVVSELTQALAQDDVDARRVAVIIGRDPGVAAMLFKLARSALFSKGRPVGSLEQALLVVGLKPLGNLVRALALNAAIEGDREYLDRFWSRSTDIAVIASEIAEDRQDVCGIFADQAYLAGIFHDCGVPLLAQRFAGYAAMLGEAAEANRWASSLEEDRRFAVDHSVVGYWVARHWGLPDFVADAIRFHHELDQLDEHRARSMVAILQLALYLYGCSRGLDLQDWFRVRDLVLEELALHLDELPEYADEIRERCLRQA